MEGLRMLERITLEQLKEQAELSEVKNRYEGYGISAEGYVSIQKAMKSVEALKLAAQCQRILADLYDKERVISPMEEYIESLDEDDENFEEVSEEE